MTDEHFNGFQHLELELSLEDLEHGYDLGWKFDANTDGPSGWDGEPFLLLYISFRMTTGERRRSGTLHYALTRSSWGETSEVSEADRSHLRELAFARVQEDLLAVEKGTEPAWLTDRSPLFVSA